MAKVETREPTYCSVEDIEQALDIPTPGSPTGETMIFTDETHPTRDYVKKLILSAEDEIDRRCRYSWRENIVKDQIEDVRSYQPDENGWRTMYYLSGGNVVNLHKNICHWNPNPIYEFYRDDDGQIILEPLKGDDDLPLYVHKRSGSIIYDDNGDPKMECVEAFYRDTSADEQWIKYDKKVYVPLTDGELEYQVVPGEEEIPTYWQPDAPKPKRMIYSGDKLELRRPMFYFQRAPADNEHKMWIDISNNLDENPDNSMPNAWFWFDYKSGRLFIRSAFYQARYNAIRITYRWGADEPVPMQISRACSLMVAIQILNGSAFALKFGVGGDMANVRDGIVSNWEYEIGRAFTSYQRAGTVRSWSR